MKSKAKILVVLVVVIIHLVCSGDIRLSDWSGMTDVRLEHIQDILTLLASCVYHGSHNGVTTRARLGAEAAADLAMDDRITQRAFRSIVVVGDTGIIEKDKQAVVMFLIAPLQLLSLGGGDGSPKQGVTVGFQLGDGPLVDSGRQLLPTLDQALGTQQQPLHVVGPS